MTDILDFARTLATEQAVIRANEPTIDELRSRANHPAFAAHRTVDEATVAPVVDIVRYRAQRRGGLR